jgi:2-dehydro-3-deoxyphosphogluconate aldolase/(4S)-4-hydroxy-2-oxoglutarate aldolase
MVKVFPANLFGPAYFKDVRGPFADLELLACGGVNASNAGAYFAAGASAVAFGGSIFKSDWLRTGAFQQIGHAIRELIIAIP